MQNKQRRVAAALAAVQLYLQEEEAAALVVQEQAATAPKIAVDPGAWAQAGRIEAMSARRMMQMRAFARTC